MVFLLPAWANRPKEYKKGGMVQMKADGGGVGKYGTAFLTWKADGTADMDRPLRGMADGGRVNLAVGFPYGIYNSPMPNLPAPYNPGPRRDIMMTGKMANGGYTIQPGTPFYNYFNALRNNKIGA